jgi:hypothetical protein
MRTALQQWGQQLQLECNAAGHRSSVENLTTLITVPSAGKNRNLTNELHGAESFLRS